MQQQKEVRVRDGVIRYYDIGAGPVVLFVHGFMTNGRLWLPVAERIKHAYRCIVPDWPLGSHAVAMGEGADLSQPGIVAIMTEFVEALGLRQFSVVGNDMGGALSQQFTAAHPEKVERLVLTPCDVFDNFPPGLFKFLVHLPKIGPFAAGLSNAMRMKPLWRLPISYGWLCKHGLSDETIAHFVQPIIHDKAVRRDAVKVIGGATPAVLHAIRHRLAAFDKPVHIVWPPEEKVFPFADAGILASVFPKATIVPVADSYTFVSLDQPEVLSRVLLEGARV